ncbi:MAG: sensor histidine kinase [Acidimicrobiales bacterium]
MLVLVGLGLLASDLATYSALHSYLEVRVNDQLAQSRRPMERVLNQSLVAGTSIDTAALRAIIPPDTYVEVLDASGTVLLRLPSGTRHTPDPAPRLPAKLSVSPPSRGPGGSGDLTGSNPSSFVTGAVGASGFEYRVQAVSVGNGSVILVVAASLQSENQTLHRLVIIEEVASGAVLLALFLMALWVVRLGLRPLDEMTEAAGAIAAGDLDRRVTRTEETTEVGRLGAAFNSMLVQIQDAFLRRDQSDARLRRFVADASHELRTPLTSIRGYAELFGRGAVSKPDELASAMSRIESEAARMSTLVDDLLLLARLDQGRPLRRDRVDLRAIASDALADAQASDHDRPLTLDVPPVPVVVIGDEDRLRQVLANLVSNALTHTPVATPVIIRVIPGAETVTLEVADQGPGLAPEAARLAFERFYRGDAARGRGGAGLGLSIVAAIAQSHGGQASVESVAGRGASFRVSLPSALPAVTGT